MLINLSNHPSAKWSDAQLQAANTQYGEVVDLMFPQVAPDADVKDIQRIAEEYLQKVQNIAPATEAAIHVMGEMTLTYALVNILKAAGYQCVASTTIREVYEEEPGKKIVLFNFVKFREY